jgi:predicted Rossmann-fold nucleotide-binding protein
MIVGVMASGDDSLVKKHEKLAQTVGGTIAELGFHLLTGGGGGLMEAVGQAFLDQKQRTGKSISILRPKDTTHLTSDWNNKGELKEPRKERETKRIWEPRKDNKLGEIVIRTHLPYSGDLGLHDLSRNHINALTSDLVVVLPGEEGTYSELKLAWQYHKDIMIFLGEGKLWKKTTEELVSNFQGISVGYIKTDLEDWLNRTRTNILRRGAAKPHL